MANKADNFYLLEATKTEASEPKLTSNDLFFFPINKKDEKVALNKLKNVSHLCDSVEFDEYKQSTLANEVKLTQQINSKTSDNNNSFDYLLSPENKLSKKKEVEKFRNKHCNSVITVPSTIKANTQKENNYWTVIKKNNPKLNNLDLIDFYANTEFNEKEAIAKTKMNLLNLATVNKNGVKKHIDIENQSYNMNTKKKNNMLMYEKLNGFKNSIENGIEK